MKFTAFVGMIMLMAIPALAVETGGVTLSNETGSQGVPADARESLADSWNDTETHSGASTYSAQHFGFAYTPSTSYTLNRVEWYAGGIAGTVTVAIHADSGSGYPDGALLASATYGESDVTSWQGGNLDTPVALNAGTTYYIKYTTVNGAFLSDATSGTVVAHSWYYDSNGFWEGPGAFFYWMARFYGDISTPTGNISWSEIKGSF
ncbi:DUF4082 domain-containing protein [bacterium]|nr:DUF4082 domain-containing protein [bacterium]